MNNERYAYLLQSVRLQQLFVRANRVRPICHAFHYLRPELPTIHTIINCNTTLDQYNSLRLAQLHLVSSVLPGVYSVDPVHQLPRIPNNIAQLVNTNSNASEIIQIHSLLVIICPKCTVIVPTEMGIGRPLHVAAIQDSCIQHSRNQQVPHNFLASDTYRHQCAPVLPSI